MTTKHFLSLTLLVACGDPTSAREQPDGVAPDASTPQVAMCDGESFVLHGAVERATTSAATVTVNGKVAGVNGAVGSDRLYALNVRLGAGGMLDGIGTYDIATLNLQYLDQPFGGCGNGPCTGFFATAGTYEVLAMQPMYRATFMLRDLRERANADSPPGAPMPGEITGCVSAAL